jgi:hypothetical protein
MAAGATARVEGETRRVGNMVSEEDDAFEQELKAAPWGYGQKQGNRLANAFVAMRRMGLHDEATLLELEIKTLRNEIEYLLNR